jgi:hypothetical protein
MKKTINKMVAIAMCIVLFTACRKEKINGFKNENAVKEEETQFLPKIKKGWQLLEVSKALDTPYRFHHRMDTPYISGNVIDTPYRR